MPRARSRAGMMIFDVRLEMLRQIRDTRSQERNLDLWGSSVARSPLIFLHQLGFLRRVYGHGCLSG